MPIFAKKTNIYAYSTGDPRTGAADAFHAGDRFGTVKGALELAVLEKNLHK